MGWHLVTVRINLLVVVMSLILDRWELIIIIYKETSKTLWKIYLKYVLGLVL